ncbi:metalloproteinase inhibitor 3-like [Mizuhopecten yessoensis]|uniref:Metalloproteinase inhibitor 3 n=1 Tax=Mizuhopecten yessoensis TaxID=6573 RepID=A0A210Q0R5_MIZYE|nr:metalloproteinase inhibitor 3-like [Mizuhopecten yessoensis]OWF42326.1 Metalloproteinase inhibitor 3 [Mizuhopecten yessoensis]
MLGASILVLASVALSLIPVSEGCTCLFRHPQAVVCDSDFVIKGDQVGQQIIPLTGDFPDIGGHVVYKILIKTVIKGKQIKAGDTIEVRTGLNSAACGVNVTAGVAWLLTGRTTKLKGKTQYGIGLCDWNTECSRLTPQQTSFLVNGPKSYFGRGNRNCKNCEIVRCASNDCSTTKPTAGQCLHDAKQCFSQTLKCQFKKNRCQWRSKKDARKCLRS